MWRMPFVPWRHMMAQAGVTFCFALGGTAETMLESGLVGAPESPSHRGLASRRLRVSFSAKRFAR